MKKLADYTKTDVLIVGAGVAGLYCALNLPDNLNIIIITKGELEECDSYLAQGGICMLRDENDYDSYFEDTMRAGHYENNTESVDIMLRSSQDVVRDLIKYGTRFEKDEKGNLAFTREGAHSAPRILYHEDITGKEITSHLLKAVKKLPNVTLYENVTMVDIISSDMKNDLNPYCQGIVAQLGNENGKLIRILSNEVVLACGGIGGLYEHSTNYAILTGDALAISLKHGIKLRNIDYIQIHPTTLYSQKPGRAFLISESVRGEGGILLNDKGVRFTDELQPRDVVTKAIHDEMARTGQKHVWLSMEDIPTDIIKSHFKHIYEHCLEEGYDCTKEPIPVVPAQHYFMGGVDVNSDSRTSMEQLYAVGETSCNGVHGANRLASNSLLESLVFAKRAALKIAEEYDNTRYDEELADMIDIHEYENMEQIVSTYKESVLSEIERMKKYHEQHNHEIKRRRPDSVSA